MTLAQFMKKQSTVRELNEAITNFKELLQLAYEAGENEGFDRGYKKGLASRSGKETTTKIKALKRPA